MNRLAITLFLAAFSGSAAADWVDLGGKGDKVTLYTDPATIRKSGNMVKMWSMIDFNVPQKSSYDGRLYFSHREQDEYDCKEERRRVLSFSRHSGHMAAGDVLISDSTASQWIPIAPGTIEQALWNVACGKK